MLEGEIQRSRSFPRVYGQLMVARGATSLVVEPCFCKWPLTHTLVNNPNYTHHFTKMNLKRIISLIYQWYPLWGEKTFACLLGKSLHSTYSGSVYHFLFLAVVDRLPILGLQDWRKVMYIVHPLPGCLIPPQHAGFYLLVQLLGDLTPGVHSVLPQRRVL